ncbi:MAG: Ig-like domain-containing protein, partial [Verrucomicrobiota bacterium]|nr:Ig-like domain-containing protein [Verrucomicrobiota bacterium]
MSFKKSFFCNPLVILLTVIISTESGIAEPEAANDTYQLFEDSTLKTGSGPLVELYFDSETISGFIENDWAILDRIENQNGDAEDYPTDGSGREWLDPEFDIDSSNVGPWFVAPLPIQSGTIDAFPGLDDELFGIDEAANGENLITTYLFRNSFTLDETEAQSTDWELSYLADDGIIVYINGTEVFRSAAIPAGQITAQTPADAGANDESSYSNAVIDLEGLLFEGNNSIAVELHQAGVESSDIGLDLNITPAANQGGAGSFSYIDDAFPEPFSTSAPNNATGDIENGAGFESTNAAHVRVGGGWFFGQVTSSGAWRQTLSVALDTEVKISFRYRLIVSENYEDDEYGAVVFAVDGNFIGDGGDEIDRLTGDGQSDTGWRTFSTEVSLSSGNHNIDFGVYNNKANSGNELTDVWFDDILIEYVGAGSSAGVLENDEIGEGQVTAEIASNPSHGTVEMNADGSFTYFPEEDFFGMDQFTYTVRDDSGVSPAAEVNLEVISVNDLPVIQDRTFSVTEDERLLVSIDSGLGVDSSDVENQELTFTVESAPSNGNVEINLDGSFEYVPNLNFEGTDRFTYVALDGEDSSVPSEVEIEVISVNDPPEVVDDTYSVIENNSLVVSQSGISLPETVLFEDFENEFNFAFTGNVDIEPVGEYASIDGFEGNFLRNLTSGNPADATTITINDLPPHDRLSIGFVLAIIDSWDGDAGGGDFFTIRIDGENVFSHTFNSQADGSQSYVAPQGVELARSIDLGFSSGPQSFDSAYDLSKEPSLRNIAHSGDSVTIEIFASGANWEGGDDESWAIDNFEVRSYQSAQIDLISEGSVWLYLDDGSDQGRDWIDEDYDDSDWESGAGKFGYGDDNEATLINFGDDEDDKYVTTYFRHWFEVEDSQRYEGLLIGLLRDDGAAVYINGTEVARSNLEDGAGAQDYAIDFAGGDDENNFFEFPVDASVLMPGENLIAVEVHQNSGSSSDLGFDLRFTGTLSRASAILGNDIDVDTESLQVSLLSPPDNGKLQLQSDGSFTYVPNVNFEGNDSFEYAVSDGEFEDSGKVFITVEPGPNDLPIVTGEEYQVKEDMSLIVDAGSGVLENDYDPDGVEITAALASSPENGSVELSEDGSFTYSPDQNFYGVDQFTYYVADAFGKAPPAVVIINVEQVNDAPIAIDDNYLTAPDTELEVVAGGLLANDIDPDGDGLQSEILTEPESGIINFEGNGSFSYVPIPGFSGQVSFTYRVTDGEIFSASAEVTIDINASPETKVSRYVVYEDGVLSRTTEFGVLARSSDLEGDALFANLVQSTSHGSLSLLPDGSFTYTPDTDFSGLDIFTYSVSDGYQESSPV